MAQRLVLVMATWLIATAALGAEPVLQLATFRADVTPPIGDGPCVGFMPKVNSVEHPLEVRGVVLRANGQTFVIAAIDYQGLCNSSDDEFRKRMADAAETTPGRVALQSLHQHAAGDHGVATAGDLPGQLLTPACLPVLRLRVQIHLRCIAMWRPSEASRG
jgi:hypothetical protein